MIKNKGYPFSKRKFQILNSKFQISKEKNLFQRTTKINQGCLSKRGKFKKRERERERERGRSHIANQWNNKALII